MPRSRLRPSVPCRRLHLLDTVDLCSHLPKLRVDWTEMAKVLSYHQSEFSRWPTLQLPYSAISFWTFFITGAQTKARSLHSLWFTLNWTAHYTMYSGTAGCVGIAWKKNSTSPLHRYTVLAMMPFLLFLTRAKEDNSPVNSLCCGSYGLSAAIIHLNFMASKSIPAGFLCVSGSSFKTVLNREGETKRKAGSGERTPTWGST